MSDSIHLDPPVDIKNRAGMVVGSYQVVRETLPTGKSRVININLSDETNALRGVLKLDHAKLTIAVVHDNEAHDRFEIAPVRNPQTLIDFLPRLFLNNETSIMESPIQNIAEALGAHVRRELDRTERAPWN